MPRDRDHLQLPLAQMPLTRRKRPAPAKPRGDRTTHGERLDERAEAVSNALKAPIRPLPAELNPAYIFRLTIAPSRALDDEMLRRMGLRLLGRDAHRALVVSTGEEDLHTLRNRLAQYSGRSPGAQYAELDAVEDISLLGPEDRTGPGLERNPFVKDEIAAVDVELWHSGAAECRQRIGELRQASAIQNLQVLDDWVGENICLVRARLSAAALDTLLSWHAIKQIDRRPRPSFEIAEYMGLGTTDFIADEAAPDLVGVLVLDSGVAGLHPLIGNALGDAQAFPARLIDEHGASAADATGHGTGVGGIAIYGDVLHGVRIRRFTPTARLFSARVTDDNGHYDEETLLEHQLADAVDYFLQHYPQVRVINISLGNSDHVLTEQPYQFRFAAAVDELARRYADRNIVIVISAGNFWRDLEPDEFRHIYPACLLQPEARLIDPATAALAITVGGLSQGIVQEPHSDERVMLAIGGHANYPSPFTCTGPGFEGAIKPELVDDAGDVFFADRRQKDSGVLTMNKDFAPPAARLFKRQLGTSFAAPKVANMAAQLMREYPEYSSNLIRALLVHSAEVPEDRPASLTEKKSWDPDMLRIYGYGKPSFERAQKAAGNDAWLLHEGEAVADTFTIFELPALPDDFLDREGRRRIGVTLAYDPPTRQTRADSYLGIRMEFALYRNVLLADLTDAYRKWDRDEQEDLPEGAPPGLTGLKGKLDLKPNGKSRGRGTVQHGSLEFQRSNWRYDRGTPLYLVVICQRKWAPASISNQRFAVIASLHHADPEVELHARLRERTRLYGRERVRV